MYSCLHQRDSLKDSVRWPETPGCLIPVSQSIVGCGCWECEYWWGCRGKTGAETPGSYFRHHNGEGLIKMLSFQQVLQNLREKCWKEALWHSWVKRKECAFPQQLFLVLRLPPGMCGWSKDKGDYTQLSWGKYLNAQDAKFLFGFTRKEFTGRMYQLGISVDCW